MYNPFRINRVYTNMKDRKIILEATHDVLEESVNNKNITVFEESSRNNLGLNFKVNGKYIEIEFPDFPIPNSEYVVIANNIYSVAEEELNRTFKKNIVFKSSITSEITILSPSDHEKVKDALIIWKEEQLDNRKEKEDNYYIEISTDPAFYNKVVTTIVTGKNEYLLPELKHKQYYVRIRAQNDKEFGLFSETITFKTDIKKEESPSVIDIPDFVNNNSEDEEDELPMLYEPMAIIDGPTDGITPEKIIIKFNKEIDPEVARKIKVYRRSI